MNLSGSLSSFGLADVFALLAMTSKSGALRVRRPSAESPERCGVVRFDGGSIVAASSDEGRQALVRRLIGSGLVDDAALSAAVDRARADGTGIARALRDAGTVDDERLRRAAEEQVVDGVFELLQWIEGDFEFSVDESDPDDIDVHLGVEEVVGQAHEREGAWRSVMEVIPSVDSVLTVPVRRDDETVLAPEEWAIVSMVDGARSVADLVELTGRGDFGVMTTAADLVRRGILVVRPEGEDDHVGIVLRRLGLLAPLETSAPTPVPPRPAPRRAAARATEARESVPAARTEDARLDVVVPDSPAGLIDGDATGSAGSGAHSQEIIERDPSVNRSLLLRVIAGVKGL